MGDRLLLLKPILTGILTIIILLFCFSFLLSLLLHFSSVHEATVYWFLLPVTLLSIFIGGMMAGYKSGTKGWYIGGFTGLLFLILTWLISFLGYDASFSVQNSLTYVAYLFTCIIGGIIGVNVSPNKS